MNRPGDAATPAAESLAEQLLRARNGGGRVRAADLPSDMTEADAYAVQRRLARHLGPVGGFKIACKPGAPRIMAPIFSRDFVPNGGCLAIPAGEAVGIELEIGFRLIAELPDPRAEDFAVRARHAVEILPVIEIVRSRLEAPARVGALPNLADNQINGGLVCGPASRGWSDADAATPRACLRLGGETLLDGAASVPGGDAFANFLVLARMIGGHCGGLRPGQVVITGSLNGLPWRHPPIPVSAEIEGLGAVAVNFAVG